MRSLSGIRNRLVLLLVGVLALVAAAWLGAVAFGLFSTVGALDGVLAPGEQTVDAIVQTHRGWLLPTASVVAVLATLAGLALLIGQIPSQPGNTVLRFHDRDRTVLASVEPAVLERALADHVADVPGVLDSSVHVSGSTVDLCVQAEIAVSEGAEVEWTIGQARRLLAADVSTALGSAPRRVDLLVRLRSTAAPSRLSTDDAHERAPGGRRHENRPSAPRTRTPETV
ncbi:hypothetical protein [Dietzia sp. ANT_WB102]|uniref:hypothetical protein n=1 Tax=Dietzia sp. ANT_WB102 TaxID=2597345 RepID=UPI0011F0457B|nr:hypothetical protein [Dietzia sp. ANT_WB102]KAA0918334.1 hypothetical protein FQ137_02955 [Dietzia sp. ANT_WB102]